MCMFSLLFDRIVMILDFRKMRSKSVLRHRTGLKTWAAVLSLAA